MAIYKVNRLALGIGIELFFDHQEITMFSKFISQIQKQLN